MTNPKEDYSLNITANDTTNTTTTITNTGECREDECALQRKKAKTSTMWAEFKDVDDGSKRMNYIQCKTKLLILASGCTTLFSKNLKSCINNQQTISSQIAEKECDSTIIAPAIMDGKLDMMKIREEVAH